MTENRPEPPTLLYLIKQVELASRAGLDELTRPAGLTALQYTALTVLERHPGLTAARLARNSFVTAQSMADMVTSLLRRGLIERNRDPQDRRRLVLSLTDDGHRVLADLRPDVAVLEARMLVELPAESADELRELLEACRRGLGSRTTHARSSDSSEWGPEPDHQVS
ncbi:MarR family winged helix-turn-helix transcriptional regulator [Flexivirga oryzae]|uniref:DNA-binding MarR family transcriptional regulator n=1 Tax=Flexivirga oryzae TaxID=1794944 RepID=A0A839N6X2_9MICO|nr:MarR family transcriptional regulator [Flexivirga oryzae]MBB2891853.1 DNA-binding MarR family transcriptional regulator [Flexivirga oryzae]